MTRKKGDRDEPNGNGADGKQSVSFIPLDVSTTAPMFELRMGAHRVRVPMNFDAAALLKKFVQWFGRSPEEAKEDNLHYFFLHRRHQCNLSGSSMRLHCVGMRIFFTHVIPRQWKLLDLMHAKADQTLPVVISRQQVWQIIQATSEIQNRTYFTTIYTCGLRLKINH